LFFLDCIYSTASTSWTASTRIGQYNYYLSSTELERVDVMKDLGAVFDSELSFVSHCREKVNRAYSMLGLVKRNFIHLTEDAFVTLYKS